MPTINPPPWTTGQKIYRAYQDGWLCLPEIQLAAGEITYDDWCDIYPANMEPAKLPEAASQQALHILRSTRWMSYMEHNVRRQRGRYSRYTN